MHRIDDEIGYLGSNRIDAAARLPVAAFCLLVGSSCDFAQNFGDLLVHPRDILFYREYLYFELAVGAIA